MYQIADVDGKGGNALAHKNQKHTTPTDYNDGDKTHIAPYVFHYTGGAKAFPQSAWHGKPKWERFVRKYLSVDMKPQKRVSIQFQ